MKRLFATVALLVALAAPAKAQQPKWAIAPTQMAITAAMPSMASIVSSAISPSDVC